MANFLPAIVTRNWNKAADQFLNELALRNRLKDVESENKELKDQNKAFRKIIVKLTNGEPLEIGEMSQDGLK